MLQIFLTWILFLLIIRQSSSLPEVIRIGGLFDNTDDRHELAFRDAVNRANTNQNILPRSRLLAHIEKIPLRDSFYASKRACYLMGTGTAAIFGPQSAETSAHVQSICDALEVPHIETRWDYRLSREDYSINLYPHPSSLSQAYMDVILFWKWNTFTILYEDNDGLIRLQNLLKMPSKTPYKIRIRQLPEGDDYRSLLRQMKKTEYQIVLDCSINKVYTVLKQAQQVGMMTENHLYLITSLDLHTLDLEDFKYSGANITGFRLVDPNKPDVMKIMANWSAVESRVLGLTNMSKFALSTDTALIYDAVHLFAKALHDLDRSQDIEIKPLSCDKDNAWIHGNSLINYMKLVEMESLTGIIRFDQQGFRSNFEMDVVQLTEDGLKKIGSWSKSHGVKIPRMQSKEKLEVFHHNGTVNVVTIMSAPYVRYKESTERLYGNNRFAGFCVEILKKIGAMAGFRYNIYVVQDGKHGTYNRRTGQWNGMIKDLLEQKADLIVGDFTVTQQRQKFVEFSLPFLQHSLTAIFKRPPKLHPDLFAFLVPFSYELWMYIGAACIGVSITMFALARFSPSEWRNPHPCNLNPEELRNNFTFSNSIWFTFGSVLKHGTDVCPRGAATRCVAAVWWIASSVFVANYLAYLIATIPNAKSAAKISTVEELAEQSRLGFGCIEGGSTCSFFRDSRKMEYQQMWASMQLQTPPGPVKGFHEGLERLKTGNFALIIESTTAEFYMNEDCDIVQLDKPFMSSGYGFAVRKGSPLLRDINSAILSLQSNGEMEMIQRRWWGTGDHTQCESTRALWNQHVKPLELDQLSGIFVTLLGGMGLACILALFEFVWKTRSTEERGSLCGEMMRELKFAICCHGTRKPAHSKNSEHENGLIMPLTGYKYGRTNDRR